MTVHVQMSAFLTSSLRALLAAATAGFVRGLHSTSTAALSTHAFALRASARASTVAEPFLEGRAGAMGPPF